MSAALSASRHWAFSSTLFWIEVEEIRPACALAAADSGSVARGSLLDAVPLAANPAANARWIGT